MKQLINKLIKSPLLGRLIPTQIYCLHQELKDCHSVLDIGCGPSSPLQYCPWIKESTGVEPYLPYLETSKKKNIHSRYLNSKIQDLDFPPHSFDAVILIEVIEHLTQKDGLTIINKATKWAKKKVIITSPNGLVNQKALDGNPLQAHLSGWDLKIMKKLDFQSRGLAGLKFLRQEVEDDSMGDDLTTSIRFRPKIFWFLIATLSQVFTHRFPSLAFELFSVRKTK